MYFYLVICMNTVRLLLCRTLVRFVVYSSNPPLNLLPRGEAKLYKFYLSIIIQLSSFVFIRLSSNFLNSLTSWPCALLSPSFGGVWGGLGFYRSISGITRSNVPIAAIKSPILPPVAILFSADKFENPGERNLIL